MIYSFDVRVLAYYAWCGPGIISWSMLRGKLLLALMFILMISFMSCYYVYIDNTSVTIVMSSLYILDLECFS